MPRLDDFIKALNTIRQKKQNQDKESAEFKGMLKVIRQIFPDSETKVITTMLEYSLKETENRTTDDVALLEIILSLSSDQTRELDMLRGIIRSLASENKELLNKIGEIEDWKKNREKMLSEIDEYVGDRRKSFGNNR